MSESKVETLKEFFEWWDLNRIHVTKKAVFEVACDTIEQLQKELQEYKFDWGVWDKNKELQKENEELKGKNYSLFDTNDQQKQVIGHLEAKVEELEKETKVLKSIIEVVQMDKFQWMNWFHSLNEEQQGYFKSEILKRGKE